MEAHEPDRRVSSRLAVMLIAAGTVILFGQLGSYRSLGSHEVFVSVPAREMLETGDWIIPRYGQVPRLEKPPLAYWVVATSGWLAGEVNELAARLPSAAAAILLALLVGVWARRWYGVEAGYAAVVIQLTSLWVISYGRRAEVDMLLCLLTTAALALVATWPDTESTARSIARWLGVYSLVAIAWMAKFHFGAAMVLVPAVLYLVCCRRTSRLWHLGNPPGLVLVAAAAIAWPLAVLEQLPEAATTWRSETVGRSFGARGYQPPWDYLGPLLMLLLPWTIVLLRAVPASWRSAWRDRSTHERFLWCWIIGQSVILLASASKHPNYLLSLLPALTLVGSRRTAVLLSTWQARASTRDPRWLLAGFAVIVAISTAVNAWVMPAVDHRSHAAAFALETRRQLPDRTEVCVYRMTRAMGGMDPVVHYLRSPVRRVADIDELLEQLDRHDRLHVVTYAPTAAELARSFDVTPLSEMAIDRSISPPKHPPLVLLRLEPRVIAQRPATATPAH